MDVKICKDMSISLKKLEVYERKKGDEHAFLAVNTRTPREVPAGDHSAGELIAMADLAKVEPNSLGGGLNISLKDKAPVRLPTYIDNRKKPSSHPRTFDGCQGRPSTR